MSEDKTPTVTTTETGCKIVTAVKNYPILSIRQEKNTLGIEASQVPMYTIPEIRQAMIDTAEGGISDDEIDDVMVGVLMFLETPLL